MKLRPAVEHSWRILLCGRVRVLVEKFKAYLGALSWEIK